MDYGQTSNCNCGNHNCSSYNSEPEPRNLDDIIPAWLGKMLDIPNGGERHGMLTPVSSGPYARSKPTSIGGEIPNLQPRSTTPEPKESDMSQDTTFMQVTDANFFEMFYTAKANGYAGTTDDFRNALNNGETILLVAVAEDPTAKPVEEDQIPEIIRATGDPAILTNYVSKTIIPTFVDEIKALSKSFDGIELLRQQRRLQERLNKLMQYSVKPQRIISTAIHDKYELAIYECYLAQKVVSGEMKVNAARNIIQVARDGFHDRQALVAANHEKQAKEKEQKEILDRLRVQVTLLASDIPNLDLAGAVKCLRQLADSVAPPTQDKVAERPVTAGRVKAIQSLPRTASGSPLPELNEAKRQSFIESIRDAAVCITGHPFTNITDDELTQAIQQFGKVTGFAHRPAK